MDADRRENKNKKEKRRFSYILGIMLSFDFADIAIMDTIATASIIAAIVPNSGTTCFVVISPGASTYRSS
jgi:hypothetical protein